MVEQLLDKYDSNGSDFMFISEANDMLDALSSFLRDRGEFKDLLLEKKVAEVQSAVYTLLCDIEDNVYDIRGEIIGLLDHD